MVVGPLFGAVLYQAGGYITPLFTIGSVYIIFILVSLSASRSDKFNQEAQEKLLNEQNSTVEEDTSSLSTPITADTATSMPKVILNF